MADQQMDPGLMQKLLGLLSKDPGTPTQFTADSYGQGLSPVAQSSGLVTDPIQYHDQPSGAPVGAHNIHEIPQGLTPEMLAALAQVGAPPAAPGGALENVRVGTPKDVIAKELFPEMFDQKKKPAKE